MGCKTVCYPVSRVLGLSYVIQSPMKQHECYHVERIIGKPPPPPSPPPQNSLAEALGMKAEQAARVAKDKELRAHVRVDAALKRREKRHKDLVQQLEDKGWQLSVADRLSQGTLQGGRAKLETYLRSPAYREARQGLCLAQAPRSTLTYTDREASAALEMRAPVWGQSSDSDQESLRYTPENFNPCPLSPTSSTLVGHKSMTESLVFPKKYGFLPPSKAMEVFTVRLGNGKAMGGQSSG
jgi:hypothetical protein